MSSSAAEQKALEEFFTSHAVGELSKDKKSMITIEKRATVEAALALLTKHKILSVPVVDGSKVLGILAMSDIVIALAFNPAFAKFTTLEAVLKISLEEMKAVLDQSVMSVSCEHILGLTEEGKTVWTVKETDKLDQLAQFFARGVHRVVVTPADFKATIERPIAGVIVSQSDVVAFVQKHLKNTTTALSKALKGQSIAKLGFQPQTLKSVKVSETALAGYRRLLQWKSFRDFNLAALPIVDSKGQIVGNLSESDLRGLNTDRLLDLLFPVLDYLKQFHGVVRKPVTVTVDSTFEQVVDKVLSEKVHRVWVVDAQNKPIGALSMSDIVAKLTKLTIFDWPHATSLRTQKSI